MRHLRRVVVVATTVLIAAAVAPTPSRADLSPPDGQLTEASRFPALELYLVDAVGSTITVDFAKDPKGAAAALGQAGDSLDGLVVRVEGIDVLPSSARRRADRVPVDEQAAPQVNMRRCVEEPLGRQLAQASLTCDWVETASADSSLVVQIEQSLTRSLVGLVGNAPEFDPRVTLGARSDEGFVVVVDVPEAQLAPLSESLAGGSLGLQEFLFSVAIASPAVTGVELRSDGSCLLFATSIGADQCPGVVARDEIVSLWS